MYNSRKPQPLMAPMPPYDVAPYHDGYGDFQSYQYDYAGGYGAPPAPPNVAFRKTFGSSRGGYGSGGRSRGAAAGPGGGGKVINSHTSDMDPISMASRIFVGNVNTALVGRDHLEKVFSRFGVIRGISIHKGYAFVQYSSPSEAREAVAFTDGTSFGGKPLDVNMVSEPKQNRGAVQVGQNGSGRGAKRQRTDFSYSYGSASGTPVLKQVPITYENQQLDTSQPVASFGDVEIATADVLLCGNCRYVLRTMEDFAEHRKVPCDKVVVKSEKEAATDEPAKVFCFSCKAEFNHSWLLLKHLQVEHKMTMWEEAETKPTV